MNNQDYNSSKETNSAKNSQKKEFYNDSNEPVGEHFGIDESATDPTSVPSGEHSGETASNTIPSKEYSGYNSLDLSEQGMLTGMFRDRETTEKVFNLMLQKGYTKEEISLIMSDDTHNRHFGKDPEETDFGNKAAENAGKGTAIGSSLGAIGGVLAAIGTSIVFPGLGLVIAGPLAAGLVGAGAGGLAGGIIGALVGSGIPEDRANIYESGVKEGNIIMGVKPRNQEDAKYFEELWRSNSSEKIHYK